MNRRFAPVVGQTFGLVLVALVCLGCGGGPKLVKAGGTVKYKGAPLPKASVVLVPNDGGSPSIGSTDEAGRFTISTMGRSGAPVGSYKVAITAVRQKRAVSESEAIGMTSEQIAANHESLIPAKYNNTISSELTATVSNDPSKNDYTFELQ